MSFLSRLATAIEKHQEPAAARQSRRIWVQNLGLISASGAVMWACGAKDDGKAETGTAAPKDDPVADGTTLNGALALEHEAISLYTQASKLDVWTKDATYGQALLTIAASFLDHHKDHLKVLQGAMAALKVKDPKVADAVTAQSDDTYLQAAVKAGFKLDSTTTVLQLAAAKEAGAAKAYAGAIKSLTDVNYAYQSGLHSGDEAAHFGALRAALFALLGDKSIANDKVVPGPFPTSWILPI